MPLWLRSEATRLRAFRPGGENPLPDLELIARLFLGRPLALPPERPGHSALLFRYPCWISSPTRLRRTPSKCSCRSAPLRCLIFNVADVGLERRQPPQVDQSIVSASINISSSVFASAAGNDLTDQLEVFVHASYFFAFSPSSTSRRMASERLSSSCSRRRFVFRSRSSLAVTRKATSTACGGGGPDLSGTTS